MTSSKVPASRARVVGHRRHAETNRQRFRRHISACKSSGIVGSTTHHFGSMVVWLAVLFCMGCCAVVPGVHTYVDYTSLVLFDFVSYSANIIQCCFNSCQRMLVVGISCDVNYILMSSLVFLHIDSH